MLRVCRVFQLCPPFGGRACASQVLKAGSLTDLTLFCSSAESQYLLFLPELISVEIASLIICQKWHVFKDCCFYSIEEEKKKKMCFKETMFFQSFQGTSDSPEPRGGVTSRSILSEI